MADMRILGKIIEPYNPSTMDWRTYEQLLKNMLTLNGVVDESQKKMHIMGMIGMTAFGELVHAMEGKEVNDLTSEELLTMLGNRYAPKKLLVAQRDKFLNIKQKPTQTLTELVAELQAVSGSCEFEKITTAEKAREAFMLQGFLRALKSESVRVRLLQAENLDFKKAYELASIYEEADKEGPSLGKQREMPYVGHVQDDYQHRQNEYRQRHGRAQTPFRGRSRRESSPDGSPNRGRESCGFCGNSHEFGKCPAYGKECGNCGKLNHFARMCRSRACQQSPRPSQRTHQVSDTERMESVKYATDDFDFYVKSVNLEAKPRKVNLEAKPRKVNLEAEPWKVNLEMEPWNVNSDEELWNASMDKEPWETKPEEKRWNEDDFENEPPREILIEINGKPIKFELDTGAGPTIITESEWKRIGIPELRKHKRTLKAYQGHPIVTIGVATVCAALDGKKVNTTVYVVRNGTPICGRSMIRDLNINCGPYYSPSVNQTKELISLNLESILEANKEVLRDDAGSVKEEVKLKLNRMCACNTDYANLTPHNCIKGGGNRAEASFAFFGSPQPPDSQRPPPPSTMSDDPLGKILALLKERDRSRSPIRRRSPPRRDYVDNSRHRPQPRFPVEPSGSQGREQRVEMAIAKQTATATVAAEKFFKLVEEKLDEKFKNINENMKEFNENLMTLDDRLNGIDKQLQALNAAKKDAKDHKRNSA